VLGAAGCADDGPTTVAPTVVSVAAQPCQRPTRDLGLGVVVGDGLVLTVAHPVDRPVPTVTVADRPAHVVAIDAAHVAAVAGCSIDVVIMRTGSLVVDDATAGATAERAVHTFQPAVAPGTSRAPLVDDDGRGHRRGRQPRRWSSSISTAGAKR
jgi:hypothetical protein